MSYALALEDRTVVLIQKCGVFFVPLELGYLLLFLYFELYPLVLSTSCCLAFLGASVSLVGRNYIWWGKFFCFIGWYWAILFHGLAFSAESGIHPLLFVVAVLWCILFDVHESLIHGICLAFFSAGSFLWLGSQDLALLNVDPIILLQVNRIMKPTMIATSFMCCVLFVGWLKEVESDNEKKLDGIIDSLLPRSIVARMKGGERVIADTRSDAVILFCDIVDYTSITSGLKAKQVVEGMGVIFGQMERIMMEFPRVEKIKTVGDAMMCASGLHHDGEEPEDLIQMAEFALALRDFKFQFSYTQAFSGSTVTIPIQIRVGFHCGPVIAGILSSQRISFDVIGDPVNVASRMETTCLPSKIHVSSQVKRKLDALFQFEDRGPTNVKGKGDMNTYFLQGRS